MSIRPTFFSVDVHELHGNAPFVGEEKKFLRVACVYYFRTGILDCGSPAEESTRVENRRKSSHVFIPSSASGV